VRLLAALLLVLSCQVPAAFAHLPQLFGVEYVRAEEHPLAAPQAGGEVSGPGGERAQAGGSDAVLVRRITDSEHSTGPFTPGLVDPLISLGSLYQAQGDYDEALQAYQRALHVIRVNDGLISEYQIPALRRLMALYRDLGDYARLHEAYAYLFRLRTRAGPPYSAGALSDSLEYFQWQRQTYAASGSARRDSHLLQAYRDNRRMLEALATRADEELEAYRRLAFSQLHNLYLILGIDPSRLQGSGISLEQDFTDEAARQHLLQVQEMGLYEGKNLILGLIELSRDARAEDLAALHLELGDWFQWNESQRRAREQYQEVYRLLRKAGREDLIAGWLDAPVELPDEREAWLQPSSTTAPEAVVVARYRVSERGDVRDLDVRLHGSGEGPAAAKVGRMLRDTHFRPKFSGGQPQASGEVTRYYRLLD